MKCAYCGEEEGIEKIADPNLDMGDDIDWSDDKNWWMVCKDCKEVIHLQKLHSISAHVGDEKTVSEYNKKLEEIANRIGKPILCASIINDKGKIKTASIEFTGDSKTEK